ncbi:MAG TPA: dihydropteroate synthase [Actinomycetes bacterium]|nr:dihydropteroate synthase [Actinomycetes bacterium]
MSHPATDLPSPGRCVIMGVINVTPDSFSDGGRYFDRSAAVERGLELVRSGADIVDVGGESTRPGAGRIDAAEEASRVLPVIRELAAAGGYVSVDTMRAEVAAAALEAGARMVNDVSGGLADPAMIPLIAQAGRPYVIMHWRGHSATMQDKARYADVVAEVCDELGQRYQAAAEGGVDPELIILDPGLGFAKLPRHNWALLANLDRIASIGLPVLVGASRKRFLGELIASAGAGTDGGPRPDTGREYATVAVSAIAALAGAWGVRVHEVPGSLDAVKVAASVRAARAGHVAEAAGR